MRINITSTYPRLLSVIDRCFSSYNETHNRKRPQHYRATSQSPLLTLLSNMAAAASLRYMGQYGGGCG